MHGSCPRLDVPVPGMAGAPEEHTGSSQLGADITAVGKPRAANFQRRVAVPRAGTIYPFLSSP